MTTTKFEGLSPDQERLIPTYRDKWIGIARSTERINRKEASEAVKLAYAVVGEDNPEIFFFNSPYAALNSVKNQLWEQLQFQLITEVWSTILEDLANCLREQLFCLVPYPVWDSLWDQLWNHVESQLVNQLGIVQMANYRDTYLYGECIEIESWACFGSFFDFCISILEHTPNQEMWRAFQALSSNSYWVYPYKRACLVCDRPIKISLDEQNCIHAEGEPAIQFADGFSIYARRGKYVHHEVITPT
jgi:hypothetical protein